jgi:hypothetical protein
MHGRIGGCMGAGIRGFLEVGCKIHDANDAGCVIEGVRCKMYDDRCLGNRFIHRLLVLDVWFMASGL